MMKPTKQQKVITTIYIDQTTKRRLLKLAHDDVRSVSSMVEIILRKYLAQIDESQGRRVA